MNKCWPLPFLNRFKAILSACKYERSMSQIHAVITTAGLFFAKPDLGSHLVASYGRIGCMTAARQVFEELPQRDTSVWNAIIIAYSRKNYPREVLNLYFEMIGEGVRPNSSTFTVALKACSSLMELEIGETIWGQAVDLGFKNDVFVGSAVLNLYAKCGKMSDAERVFDKMGKRDVVCWTTMITGFLQCGKALEAVDVFVRMQKEGIEGDGIVMLGLVQACAMLGHAKWGLSVHGYMVRREIKMDDVVLQTSLVDMYAKNGCLELASRVLKEMPYKNSVSWAALISGFAQNGYAASALQLLVDMQRFGYEPDTVSLMSAIMACSQVGYLKLGKSIHGYILRRLDFELVLSTAVLDMYVKCGMLSCARTIFHHMDCKDLVLWNTMISGYGIHGQGKEALAIFLGMREAAIKPDQITFASLLSALSHAGQVEEGQYWFDIMVNEYNIKPSEKHYACMIDLLSRAGLVEEAYRLIETMDIEPGLAIWVALLSGCHNCGNLLIGELAAKRILESSPDDSGIYALVSNFFAKARKWTDVAALKKIMKDTGMRKVPGYSAVEVNGKLHTFLKEENSHNQNKEIIQMLEFLHDEMKPIRCIPDAEISVP